MCDKDAKILAELFKVPEEAFLPYEDEIEETSFPYEDEDFMLFS
jgi:hypothetical protein